jgi:hypothetical protein
MIVKNIGIVELPPILRLNKYSKMVKYHAQLHLFVSKVLLSDPQQQYIARLHGGFRIVTAFASLYLCAATSIRSVFCACEYPSKYERDLIGNFTKRKFL